MGAEVGKMRNRNSMALYSGKRVDLVGMSLAMTCVKNEIARVSPANSVVLILGPTGTGKELVAKTIHDLSPRREGPFMVVNCGAIPCPLFESELFGSVRGAFNGAVNRMGRFEAANGGTIFLDEVGELPLDLQVKLLRVLQEKTIQRLGDNLDRKVDCRVIAATNRDLRDACNAGTFREDLYYRLNIAAIKLPPLRERIEDIPLLVDHFLRKLPSKMFNPDYPVPRISDGALKVLMRHSFPGNVRELENIIERAILNSEERMILFENLPENIRAGVGGNVARRKPSFGLTEVVRIALLSGNTGQVKSRTKSIRTVKLEEISMFLAETEGREFSRKDFAMFLRRCGRIDFNRSVDGTAGRYLRSLCRSGVVKHNNCKANKSGFRLSGEYLPET